MVNKKKRIIARKKGVVKKRRKTQKPQNFLVKLALILGVFLAIIISFFYFSFSKKSVGKIAQHDSLQLETFYPSPTPTPTSPPQETCGHVEDGHNSDSVCMCPFYFIRCENKQCVEFDPAHSGMKDRFGHQFSCDDTRPPNWHFNWCDNPATSTSDGWVCLDKPVIYLYPLVPTLVHVSVNTTGSIVVSDPTYPVGGWQQVLAQPSGELVYKNKTYRELFYESNVKNVKTLQSGLTINSQNLEQELDTIISKLGLIESEKEEFLSYWTPRLKSLHTPYILFSLVDPVEKEKVDHVEISPKPDTMIQFIAYFKGLENPYPGPALELPTTPPQRIGFTAVEWGGTIDSK